MKFLLAVVCACAIIPDIFSWPVAQSRRDLVHLFKASRRNGPPPNGAQDRTPPPNHGFRPPNTPAGDRWLPILDEVKDKLKEEFDLDTCLPDINDFEVRDSRPDRPLPAFPPQAFLTLLRCKAIEKGLLPEAPPCIGVLPVLPAACLVTLDDIVEALNEVANEEPMGPPAEFLWFEQFMEKVEDNLGRENMELCIPRPTADLTRQGDRPAPPAFMVILMCKAIENKLMPGNHTCPDPLPALPDACTVTADELIALVEQEVSNVQVRNIGSKEQLLQRKLAVSKKELKLLKKRMTKQNKRYLAFDR